MTCLAVKKHDGFNELSTDSTGTGTEVNFEEWWCWFFSSRELYEVERFLPLGEIDRDVDKWIMLDENITGFKISRKHRVKNTELMRNRRISWLVMESFALVIVYSLSIHST